MNRILNVFLLLSFQIGYLQWGKNNSLFIFQILPIIFSKFKTDPFILIHPAIILPLLGELFILITIFQKKPNDTLRLIGLFLLSLLIILLFFIGIISSNFKIVFFTLPFIICGFLILIFEKKLK